VTEGSNVRTFTHDAAGNVTADDRSTITATTIAAGSTG
jgi:hypothetical protein